MRRWIALCVAQAAIQASIALLATGPGAAAARSGILEPSHRISDPRIDECSGIVWYQGAWWVHNDSGDGPVLYRSPTLAFDPAESLAVPSAEAIDWEDITVLGEDLFVGDIGDNARLRPFVVLYQVRPEAISESRRGGDRGGGAGGERLRTVGIHRFRYPDGPHDAEALVGVDGRILIISKLRGEAATGVYTLDGIGPSRAGEAPPSDPFPSNGPEARGAGIHVARLLSTLDLGEGEQVTAAAWHEASRTVALLTYTRILLYPADSLEGAPRAETRIAARQAEALCFRGDTLVFTNEQRDVYTLPGFVEAGWDAQLPRRGSATLAPDGAWSDLSLAAARPGDRLRWSLARDSLHLEGRFAVEVPVETTRVGGESGRLGSVLLVMFASEPDLWLDEGARVYAAGPDTSGGIGLWTVEFDGGRLRIEPASHGSARGALRAAARDAVRPAARDGDPGSEASTTLLELHLALPLTGDVLPRAVVAELRGEARRRDGNGGRFLFDAQTLRTAPADSGGPEARFSADDITGILHPYIWGEVRVTGNHGGATGEPSGQPTGERAIDRR